MGRDIDFGKKGVILEVQFANYPYLLNNVVRPELFYKANIPLTGRPTGLLIVITKAHMFPSSQSTLYYEQAANQVGALAENKVFDVPTRVVGLFEQRDAEVPAKWTEYENPRYSRTPLRHEDKKLQIVPGGSACSRCRFCIIE